MAERKGVMLAKKLSKAYLARLPEHVYFQPKINGQRLRVGPHGFLLSSQENTINSIPHIEEQLEKLASSHKFDGELWHPDLKFQEVSAIVRKTTRLDERYKMINFYIFDIITEDEQSERFNDLYGEKKAIMEQENLKVLDWYYAPKEHWERFYEMFIEQGYEGLIIRNPDALYQTKRTADLLKKKKMIVGKFRIVGAFMADAVQGVQVNMLGGLDLRTDNSDHFSCGAGCLSHTERTKIWNEFLDDDTGLYLIDSLAVIEYPELTKRGVPHQPILREIL